MASQATPSGESWPVGKSAACSVVARSRKERKEGVFMTEMVDRWMGRAPVLGKEIRGMQTGFVRELSKKCLISIKSPAGPARMNRHSLGDRRSLYRGAMPRRPRSRIGHPMERPLVPPRERFKSRGGHLEEVERSLAPEAGPRTARPAPESDRWLRGRWLVGS